MIFCMKQIIPFKKELLFKTKVSEITSISLEHTLTLKNDDLISGEFHITGDYKMTEGSINREKFQFKLPFDIALDSRYDISSIIIDIDNFYYEIINNESLQVNIDVYVEGEKLEEETSEITPQDITQEPAIIEENTEEVLLPPKEEPTIEITEDRSHKSSTKDLFKEEYQPAIEVSKPQKITLEKEDPTPISNKLEFNLFENIDNSDTYVTYYVYIVKENDTIDTILTKYNVTKEEISLYNNLESINPGTKLIIPNTNNE